MSEINTAHTEAAAIAKIAREALPLSSMENKEGRPIGRLVHEQHRLLATEIYEASPLRMRTHVKLDTPKDVVGYILRHGQQQGPTRPAVYAHRNTLTITAIIDYPNGERGPAWASHRCSCTLERSKQVKDWLTAAGNWIDQETMAEFLELNLNDIKTPTPSDVLTFVEKLTCTRKETFSSAINQTTGETQYIWAKENNAQESIKMVSEFQLAIPIWHRGEPILIGAKLHHRIREEGGKARLYFRFKLEHLDRIEDKLWDELLNNPDRGLFITLDPRADCFEGQAPEPQQPLTLPNIEAHA